MFSLVKIPRSIISTMLAVCIVYIFLYTHSTTIEKAETNQNIKVLDIVQSSEEKTKSASVTPPIRHDGEYRKFYWLKGLVFSNATMLGDLREEIASKVTVSEVKSFSPEVENHVKEIFNDQYGECDFYATIPAMLRKDGKVLVVQRIWLGQFERVKKKFESENKNLEDMTYFFHNSWQENYFYQMELDENYNLLSPGSILGLPTTTNVKFTYKSDGPMDPRLVRVGNSTLLVFHVWSVDKFSNDNIVGRVHIFDMDKHAKHRLAPSMTLARAEINWIPLDVKGEAYFTYSLDPLRVMKCDKESGDCQFIYEQPGTKDSPFVYTSDHLRGGTPWALYKYPYYISIAHNVLVSKNPRINYSMYNANIVVLCVDPWSVVYVSRNLEFDPDWLRSKAIIRNHTISEPFFYPTGLIMWDEDTLDVSGHLNDASGHILRMRGFKQLMQEVMSQAHSPSSAPVRTVQQYVVEATKRAWPGTTFFGDIIEGTVE